MRANKKGWHLRQPFVVTFDMALAKSNQALLMYSAAFASLTLAWAVLVICSGIQRKPN